MKNDKLVKILENLGLSDNEARVYLASLSLGSTTIMKIAQTAEIKRTTVYSVIDSLKQKVPAKIEKTAREKYDMIRKGEKVIEVKEE